MALLGIDLGTSGVKALLIDEAGNPLASVTREYPLHTPRPLWSEQDPEDWWRETAQAIRDVLAKAGLKGEDVRGIGLSGQMHGMTLLDSAGAVLRHAILWNDQRTAQQCAEIVQRAGGADAVRAMIANVPPPSYTSPKLLWVRENEPEIWSRVAQVLLPKDFIRYKLSGEYATEVSDATGTGLLNVGKRDWSNAMLALLDIPCAWLPVVTESHVTAAQVSASAAAATDLKIGTPIAGGGGDQAAAGVGVGSVRSGIVSVTLGTSGVIFASVDRYMLDPNAGLETFCHAVPDTWHFMGVMLSAGGSLRWHRDNVAYGDPAVASRKTLNEDPYDAMLREAARVPAGAEGLVFIPYLTGERSPHRDSLARGALVGLTVRHTPAHLTRAVVEGISFGLRDSLELMRAAGLKVSEVRAAGGGARNPIWRQWLADIFDADITLVNSSEGGAFGVALLAGVGTGVWGSVHEACDTTLRVTSRTAPTLDAAVRRRYDDTYLMYRSLYPALKGSFHALSK